MIVNKEFVNFISFTQWVKKFLNFLKTVRLAATTKWQLPFLGLGAASAGQINSVPLMQLRNWVLP